MPPLAAFQFALPSYRPSFQYAYPQTCTAHPPQPTSPSPLLSRRTALAAAAAALITGTSPSLAESPTLTATDTPAETAIKEALENPAPPLRSPVKANVTSTVYFDLKVGGKPVPRIVIGLFGEDAPVSVASFLKICAGNLRGRGGRTVGYAYSQAWRVEKDVRIDLGRVKQADEINQSPGTAQKQLVLIEVPENRDVNDLGHLVAGTVSTRRGGGAFEFVVTSGPGAVDDGGVLESENIVIGRVLEGMEAVAILNQVPTNQKTARDGFRKVGKVIGDGRAKLDLELKPLQKIVVAACGVL